jgi:hypothetical protein
MAAGHGRVAGQEEKNLLSEIGILEARLAQLTRADNARRVECETRLSAARVRLLQLREHRQTQEPGEFDATAPSLHASWRGPSCRQVFPRLAPTSASNGGASQSGDSVMGSHTSRDAGVRACTRDLLRNGIDLSELHGRRLRALLREHLDYFQLMVGGEPRVGELAALFRGETSHRGGGPNGRAHHGRRR